MTIVWEMKLMVPPPDVFPAAEAGAAPLPSYEVLPETVDARDSNSKSTPPNPASVPKMDLVMMTSLAKSMPPSVITMSVDSTLPSPEYKKVESPSDESIVSVNEKAVRVPGLVPAE